MKKKIITLGLFLTLSVSMIGCGKNDNVSSQNDAKNTETDSVENSISEEFTGYEFNCGDTWRSKPISDKMRITINDIEITLPTTCEELESKGFIIDEFGEDKTFHNYKGSVSLYQKK